MPAYVTFRNNHFSPSLMDGTGKLPYDEFFWRDHWKKQWHLLVHATTKVYIYILKYWKIIVIITFILSQHSLVFGNLFVFIYTHQTGTENATCISKFMTNSICDFWVNKELFLCAQWNNNTLKISLCNVSGLLSCII